jgi:hypothetical protein
MFKNYDLDVEEIYSTLKQENNIFTASNFTLSPVKKSGSDNIIDSISIITDGNKVTSLEIVDEGVNISYMIGNYDNTHVVLPKISYTLEELYNASFEDVKKIEPNDVQTLVCLTPDDDYAEFNSLGQVKLLTIHSQDSFYKEGEEITLNSNKIWAFTEKEMAEYLLDVIDEVGNKEIDLNTYLFSALGISPNNDYTHISSLYVDLGNIKRPAYDIDPTKQISGEEIFSTSDEDYISWFNTNLVNSYYGDNKKPWTRLGYTYNWIEPFYTYGLTEFIIDENSKCNVEYTLSLDDFTNYLITKYKGRI